MANVVPREDLGNALALNAMAVTSMRLAGAAISGVLIETVAFHWNFLPAKGCRITICAFPHHVYAFTVAIVFYFASSVLIFAFVLFNRS